MYSLIALGLLNLAGTAWVLYMFRKHRKYIGSLATDATRVSVMEPELIEIWKKKISQTVPGSLKYEAYKRSLQRHGEWPDGD